MKKSSMFLGLLSRSGLRVWVLFSGLLFLAGCGVFFPEAPDNKDIFDGPIEGLTKGQLRRFLAGDDAFSEQHTKAQGLGPIFVEASCNRCHTDDGKGHPSTNLTRFGIGDPKNSSLFNYLIELGGPQLQQRAVTGFVPESLDTIRKQVAIRHPGKVLATSVRSGPIVVGLGLIEAIPDREILKYSDPDDKDKDGISGRPNYVTPPAYHEPVTKRIPNKKGQIIGRFGRKAAAVNLLQQVVEAYINDMGITTDFSPIDLHNPLTGASGDLAPEPEVTSNVVRDVVFYMQTLRPPERRNMDSPDVKAGEAIFKKINCTGCHVPSMKTGDSPIAALRNKTVHLYSDMLLHDMGDTLADRYPEGSATGNEWRTTPLWGLGIVANTLGGQAFYMHDGRAKTLDEAIKLHGGEAKASRDAYTKLSADKKKKLTAFLQSL